MTADAGEDVFLVSLPNRWLAKQHNRTGRKRGLGDVPLDKLAPVDSDARPGIVNHWDILSLFARKDSCSNFGSFRRLLAPVIERAADAAMTKAVVLEDAVRRETLPDSSYRVIHPNFGLRRIPRHDDEQNHRVGRKRWRLA